MSSKNSLEEQIAKTVEILDKVRDSLESESDFAFGIELLIVEKFIKEKTQHRKLTSILRDTTRIIAEWRQEDYENGKKRRNRSGKNKYCKKYDKRKLFNRQNYENNSIKYKINKQHKSRIRKMKTIAQ